MYVVEFLTCDAMPVLTRQEGFIQFQQSGRADAAYGISHLFQCKDVTAAASIALDFESSYPGMSYELILTVN